MKKDPSTFSFTLHSIFFSLHLSHSLLLSLWHTSKYAGSLARKHTYTLAMFATMMVINAPLYYYFTYGVCVISRFVWKMVLVHKYSMFKMDFSSRDYWFYLFKTRCKIHDRYIYSHAQLLVFCEISSMLMCCVNCDKNFKLEI